ncbi:MAG: DNA repair protein RecN [Gemmatimonadales bacterium]
MIAELRVRDLATVADVTLQFTPGLNVLTGETGAGKSMLVDALVLLAGGRADASAIRTGASRAVIEGVFEGIAPAIQRRLEALGLDSDTDRVVVRREVAAEGRSRAWVNGSPTTVAVLARVGELILNLHGQHQTESLLTAATQRDLLDAFAGAAVELTEVRAAHRAVETLREEEAGLGGRLDEVRRKADYLRHLVAEIDGARLVVGEDERLEVEARRLGQAEAIGAHTAALLDALEDGEGAATRALHVAARAIAALERIDPGVGAWRDLLDAAETNLDELARTARAWAEGADEDPGRLAALEARRDLLYRLRHKYGASVAEVLATRDAAAAELDLLDTADTDLRALHARRFAAESALAAAAAALTARREAGAGKLARGVTRLLSRLGLPGGTFSVELQPNGQVGPHGAEQPQYVVQLNAGLEPRPLAKVVSGGELSRLMLALKVLVARHDAVPTLVFDEVDQGIGGEVGARVGEALAEVAGDRQVLVITHLPQIAACARHHLVVAKQARGGVATSDVSVAHGEDRVIELARMLGDPDAETARRHAMALLNREPAPR